MNKKYYKELEENYKDIQFEDLPQPTKTCPITSEEYDYKTYWTHRWTQNEKDLELAISGSVYLIYDNLNQVKIGKSVDVQQRLRGLEMGSGRSLKLLAKYTPRKIKYHKLEVILHNHFKKYRKIGEWFEYQFTIQDWLDVCIKHDS